MTSLIQRVRSHPRSLLAAVMLAYAFVIHFAHATYLFPIWEYFSFTYAPPEPIQFALMVVLICLCAWVMPTQLDSASSIVLLLLVIVVYVPTVVITIGLNTTEDNPFLLLTVVFALSFCAACLLAHGKPHDGATRDHLPSAGLEAFFVAGWLILTLMLVANYASIMRFSGLEDIYTQRAAALDDSVLMAYAKSYYSSVFSPALFALGLVKRSGRMVLMGLGGCIIMYMIAAQRTIFLLPIAMFGLNVLLVSRRRLLHTTAFPIFLIGALTLLVVANYEDNLVAFFIAADLVFRTLAIPGSMLFKYYQLFSEGGFTWWSHVKGVSTFVTPPAFFSGHPAWPSLGYIVGEHYHGNSAINENANLFAGDGAAAAGLLGIFVMSMVLALWLRWLNRVTRQWDPRFAVLVIFPIANDLTNGPFFTTMLSFGGIFWLLVNPYFTQRRESLPFGGKHAQ